MPLYTCLNTRLVSALFYGVDDECGGVLQNFELAFLLMAVLLLVQNSMRGRAWTISVDITLQLMPTSFGMPKTSNYQKTCFISTELA